LDKLYDEFRLFGALLNAKIEKLQFVVVDPNDPDDCNLQYMTNLRECVRSAADVVSTASTNFNVDSNDKIPGRCGSDFGDIFVKDANEPMLRWFASNIVYEYEDVEAPIPAPPDASTGDALTEYHSDTDSDIENDMIRSLFKEGKRRQGQGDLTGAVRRFQNCLTRFSSNASYASLTTAQILTVCGVSKVELLENTTDCYRALGLWTEAKATMGVKLQITEHQVGKKDALYLKDTMKLAEIMMKNQDYVDAHLRARRSLRGFKKLGEQGQTDYESCLELLIKICQLEGKEDEEEAYAALLSGHARNVQRSTSKSQPARLDPDIIQPQLPSTLALQVEPNTALSATKQMDKTIPQPPKPVAENLLHVETDIVAFGGEDERLLHPKKCAEAPLPHVRSDSPQTKSMEAKDDKSRKLNQQSSSFSKIQPPTLDTTEDLERMGLIAPPVKYGKPPSLYGSAYNLGSFDTLPDPHNLSYAERGWRDVSTSGENSPIRHDASDSSMRDEHATGQGFIGKLLAKSYAAFKGDKTHRRAVASSSQTFSNARKPNTYTPSVVPDAYPYVVPSIQSWASSIPLCPPSIDGSIYSVSTSFEGWDAYPRASTTPEGKYPPAYPNRTHCPICHISLSNMTLDAAWLHEHCCVEGINGAVDLPQQNQEQQNRDQESSMRDPPILSALSARVDPIRRKILLLGDTGRAIECLAGAWTSGEDSAPFPEVVRKKTINIEGRQIDFNIWEIKPTPLLGRLLPHSPTTTHMLLICLDTNEPSKFRNTALMVCLIVPFALKCSELTISVERGSP